jgi:hypothetical protein
VVLGHSFGGGVATKFVHDHVDAATYLVLLNSVGRPAVVPGASRSMLSMNGGPGELLRPLLGALHPSGDGIATFATTQRLFMENMARHPVSVLETAGLALTADLSNEMSTLAARKVPVLVLWSDHDEIVPMSAFDTFCTTFGTDGHVVRGGHSWLLANPKAFDEVLANVIHLQREAYGSTAARANAAQLQDLLRETTVPRAVTTRLLEDVSPLWVLSEAPAVLAADLALCHPRLGDGEVRAVAREIPGTGMFRLTVVAHDRPALLADTTAALAAEGVSIVAASAMTWPKQGLALHSVTVRSGRGFDPARWATIGERPARDAALATSIVSLRALRPCARHPIRRG